MQSKLNGLDSHQVMVQETVSKTPLIVGSKKLKSQGKFSSSTTSSIGQLKKAFGNQNSRLVENITKSKFNYGTNSKQNLIYTRNAEANMFKSD